MKCKYLKEVTLVVRVIVVIKYYYGEYQQEPSVYRTQRYAVTLRTFRFNTDPVNYPGVACPYAKSYLEDYINSQKTSSRFGYHEVYETESFEILNVPPPNKYSKKLIRIERL